MKDYTKDNEILLRKLEMISDDLVKKVSEIYSSYKSGNLAEINLNTGQTLNQITESVITNSDILRGIGVYALSEGSEPTDGTGSFLAGYPVVFGADEDTGKLIHLGVVNDGVPVLGADINGNVFMGSDIQDPSTTAWSLFAVAQTYNGEDVEAGDILFGDNSSGKANVLWDVSEGQLKFRGGTTVAAYIDTDGTLVATDANIGGWTVTADAIKDAAGAVGMSSAVTAGDDIRFWAGDATPADAPFKVTEAGTLTASDATITGSVTATSGDIAGWTIAASEIKKLVANVGIILDSANQIIKVGDTAGTHIQIDGANKRIRSSNYVAGATGFNIDADNGDAEFGKITARGEMLSAVMINTAVGETLLVLPADVLDVDMTAADASTLTIKGKITLAVGDILWMKDETDEEWLEVTNIASAPTYSVTRDKAAAYGADANPAWKAGQAVINYMQSGDGGIKIVSGAAPKVSCFTHAGSPWTTITEETYLNQDGVSINATVTLPAPDQNTLKLGDAKLYQHSNAGGKELNIENGTVASTDARTTRIKAINNTGQSYLSLTPGAGATLYAPGGKLDINSSTIALYHGTDSILSAASTQITTNLRNVIINNGGGDYDFTVMGNTDNSLLFVNAGLDNVGIGASQISGIKFGVAGDTNLNGAVTINDSNADKDTIIKGDSATIATFDAGLDALGLGGAAESGYILKATGNVKATGNGEIGGTLGVTGVQTNAVGMVINNTNADSDTTIKGDNYDILVADAGLDKVTNLAWDGWNIRTETWTRTGNHTFTVSSGSLTDAQLLVIYRKGTKVAYNDGATDYGYIISSASAGANSISVSLAANSDYAMAAATITDKAISYIENPEAFPDTFNYTPTVSASAGSITNPSITTAKFSISATRLKWWHDFTCDLESATALEIRASLPITPAFVSSFVAATRDASSGAVPLGIGLVYSVGAAYRLASGSNWSIGTTRRMYGNGEIPF